ncbi:MAG: hypothetical protein ACYC35_04470 [Pirellulales bacterium]
MMMILGVFVFLSAAVADQHAAASTFVPAERRVDMVHDLTSDVLFITNGPQILRYHLASGSFMSPIEIPGSFLRGIDLSPDGRTLAVTDGYTVGTENRIHVIDTGSLAVREVSFTRESLESGTFVPAFTSNNEVLITSSFAGSGWVPLRKVTLGPDTAVKLRSVRQSTMLTPSADLSTIAFAEANISSGSFGRYSVADGGFAGSGTGWFAFEIGVNRDGSQFAVPSYGGTFVYDSSFHELGKIGKYADEGPIGVVYSPNHDLVYFAWADWHDRHAAIDVYDTNSLSLVETIDPLPRFDWQGNSAFGEGRLEISRDGRWLFATVAGGVQIYHVPEPASLVLLAVGTLLAAIALGRVSPRTR